MHRVNSEAPIEIRFAISGKSIRYELLQGHGLQQLKQKICSEQGIDVSDQLYITKDGTTLQPGDNNNHEFFINYQSTKNRTHAQSSSGKFKPFVCMYLYDCKTLRTTESPRLRQAEEIRATLAQRKEQRLGQSRKDVNLPRSVYYQFWDFEANKDLVDKFLSQLSCLFKAAYPILHASLESAAKQLEKLFLLLEKRLKQCATTHTKNKAEAERLRQIFPEEFQRSKDGRDKSLLNVYYEQEAWNKEVSGIQRKITAFQQTVEAYGTQLKSYTEDKTGRIFEFKRLGKNSPLKQESMGMQNLVEKNGKAAASIYQKAFEYCKLNYPNKGTDQTEDKYLKQCEDALRKISDELVAMYVQLELKRPNFQIWLKQAFRQYQYMYKELQLLDKKVGLLLSQLSTFEEKLQQGSPTNLSKGYSVSVQQAQRRQSFVNKLMKLVHKTEQTIRAEEVQRKKYIAQRKKLGLSRQVFSGLQSVYSYKIRLEGQETDQFLPNLASHKKGVLQQIQINGDLDKALLELDRMMKEAGSNHNKRQKDTSPEVVSSKILTLENILSQSSLIFQQIYKRKLDQIKSIDSRQMALKQEALHGCKADLRVASNNILRLKQEQEGLKDSLADTKQALRSVSEELREKQRIWAQSKDQVAIRDKQILNLTIQVKEKQRQIKNMYEQRKVREQEITNLLKQIETLKEELAIMHQKSQNKPWVSSPSKITASAVQTEGLLKERIASLEKINQEIQEINEQMQIQRVHKDNRIQKECRRYLELEEEYRQNCRLLQEVQRLLNTKNEEVERLRQISQQKRKSSSPSSADEDEDTDKESQGRAVQFELERLREQNQRLQEELEIVNSQLRLIIMKETEDIEVQTDTQGSNLAKAISFQEFQVDKLSAFVSCVPGTYVPLVTLACSKTNIEFANATLSVYRQNIFLDVWCLGPKLRDIVNENNLIVVGRVRQIADRVATSEDNPFGLPLHERYKLVTIDRPEYILGFEEDDITLTNYADI